MMNSVYDTTLGQVADIIMGQSPSGDTYNREGNGLPLLNGPTEFGPSHPAVSIWTTAPTKICRENYLLFCVRGSTTGRMNWADQAYCLGRGVSAIRAKTGEADTRFLYYTIVDALPQLLSRCAGSVFPNLSRDDFLTFGINWPDEERRHTVAHILGALDDKINLNRGMNQTLEAMAQALFKSWFVDFDPVHAKGGGSEPAGMDAETAALFPSTFENTELGNIPQGWTVARMPEVFDINPPRSIPKDAPAPYLEMSNMPTSSARVLGWEYRDVGSGMRFINGDTLVARITPCLENGKTAFVDFLEEGQSGWGSTEYIVIRSKPPLPVEYAYFLARSDDFRNHAIQNMTGTSGRQRVPASAFDNYRIVRPSPEVSRVFGDFVSKVFATIKAHDAESATLAAIRDTLLPKLLSGDMRVQEADKAAEAALA